MTPKILASLFACAPLLTSAYAPVDTQEPPPPVVKPNQVECGEIGSPIEETRMKRAFLDVHWFVECPAGGGHPSAPSVEGVTAAFLEAAKDAIPFQCEGCVTPNSTGGPPLETNGPCKLTETPFIIVVHASSLVSTGECEDGQHHLDVLEAFEEIGLGGEVAGDPLVPGKSYVRYSYQKVALFRVIASCECFDL